MAASVNDSIDINALANVFEVPAAEDCDRHFRRESAQNCSSGIYKHRLVGLTDDWRKRAVIIEEDGELIAGANYLWNVRQCRRKHIGFTNLVVSKRVNSRSENRNSINYDYKLTI